MGPTTNSSAGPNTQTFIFRPNNTANSIGSGVINGLEISLLLSLLLDQIE